MSIRAIEADIQLACDAIANREPGVATNLYISDLEEVNALATPPEVAQDVIGDVEDLRHLAIAAHYGVLQKQSHLRRAA